MLSPRRVVEGNSSLLMTAITSSVLLLIEQTSITINALPFEEVKLHLVSARNARQTSNFR